MIISESAGDTSMTNSKSVDNCCFVTAKTFVMQQSKVMVVDSCECLGHAVKKRV